MGGKQRLCLSQKEPISLSLVSLLLIETFGDNTEQIIQQWGVESNFQCPLKQPSINRPTLASPCH